MSIYQLVVKGTLFDSDQVRNVHYYEFFSWVPAVADLQQLVDGVDAAYKTNLQAFFHDEVDIDAYDVRRVDVADLPSIEFIPTAGAWSGTATGNALPAQVSCLVTFKSTTAFPRSSRTYLFPFTEDNLSGGGLLPSSSVDEIEAWAAALLEISVSGGLNPDKQAVKFGGDPRVAVDYNDLTSYSVKRNYATQRRRKAGIGI